MRYLLGILLFAASLTFASPLTQDQVTSLYAIAVGLAHLGVPEKSPEVHLVKAQDLRKLAHCEDDEHCGVQGLAHERDIYMEDDLDYSDPHVAAVLLHEYVHYLQFVKYGPSQNCEDWLAREVQAFSVQILALTRAGHNAEAEKYDLSMYTIQKCRRANPGVA
jgi:hypothetical protein